MTPNSQRQKAFRDRQARKGLVSVTVFVPYETRGDINALATALANNPDLTVATLRDKKTGRLVSIR